MARQNVLAARARLWQRLPMDRNTLHLCPVCLRKLQWNLKFDVRERCRQLCDLYQRSGYNDLAQWMERRLAKLEVTAHNDPSSLM
jgi:hypothetical protein